MLIRAGLLCQAACIALAGVVLSAPARAEDTVKIGLIVPMTGGQASTGKQIDNAIKPVSYTHLTLPTNREV